MICLYFWHIFCSAMANGFITDGLTFPMVVILCLTLNLKKQGLTEVSSNLDVSVSKLYLVDNYFTYIPLDPFQCVSGLQHLYMAGNNLQDITFDALQCNALVSFGSEKQYTGKYTLLKIH